jgi:hypothetical protein
MTEAEIEVILQRALEQYPEAKPRIISDNGPQFIARDFKEFIRLAGSSRDASLPSGDSNDASMCADPTDSHFTFKRVVGLHYERVPELPRTRLKDAHYKQEC